jgi:radical SAM protein with 4Fe4S-binding SPASM domain
MVGKMYPLPHTVGLYGDKEDFYSSRIECGQWVFWENQVRSILAGDYNDVKPLHVELSPSYLCNFSCSWCSCRSTRSDWWGVDVFTKPNSNSIVMGNDKLITILEHLKEYNIGIQWAGGEPTMYKNFYDCVKVACDLGLPQCLFTNGSLLNKDKIISLIESNLVFIRFSLDAVTPSIHAKHHGYSIEKKYYKKVIRNLENIIQIKNEMKSTLPSVSVSIVVDETNIRDIKETLLYIYDVAMKYGEKAIEYVIIRCVQNFPGVVTNTNAETRHKLINSIKKNNLAFLLEQAHVRLVLTENNDVNLISQLEINSNCTKCIGGSMFGEITPSGEILHCSDQYGNQDYIIGDIGKDSIDIIWKSEHRKVITKKINDSKCLSKKCPRNGRGYFFNRLFYQIEEYRSDNKLYLVEKWINDLREILPKPAHPFFI